MNNLQSIIERNYESVVKRGLITDETTIMEFIQKMQEEYHEFYESVMSYGIHDKRTKEELADYLLSGLCLAKHLNIDIESELNRKIDINFERAKNGK